MERKHNCCSWKDSRKIQRKLYRIHSSAPKVQENISECQELPKAFPLVSEPVNSTLFQNCTNVPVKSNVFQNVVISAAALKQKLILQSEKDEINLQINENLKTLKQIKAKKLEILLQRIKGVSKKSEGIPRRRKIPFHELVSSAKEFLEKREREKKKAKDSILTNFDALEEALPTLEQLVEKKNKDDAKPRAAKSFSKQDAEMMEDIETYQQVLNNADYVADPVGTITAQLRQRIESGSL